MKNMNIKKIAVVALIFIGALVSTPAALAYKQCGAEVSGCSISEFSFSTGITPACFQSATNISTAAGWCDFLQIASNIIGLLYSIVIPLAVFMVAAGGLIILTAGGNEKRLSQGKAFVKSALIGVVIALGAGILIGIIIKGLGVTQETTLMPWLF
jgi:hypothetical protein